MQDAWYLDRLICPDCQADLERRENLCCDSCGYLRPCGTPLDLRPQKPRVAHLCFPRTTSVPATLEALDLSRPPPLYDGPKAERDSSELFSAAMPLLSPPCKLLDLGCGPRDQALVARHCGYQYVGVDYANTAADILADAHALPFAAATFNAVLCYAVFEHLRNPFLAAHEVKRVLQPGGVFFGAVSQGEPFHQSFFHHTAWGVLALLEAAGFRARRLWYSYDTLRALAVMGRYPKPVRLALALLHRVTIGMPFLAPRKHFQWSERERELDRLYRAASICFVADLPA